MTKFTPDQMRDRIEELQAEVNGAHEIILSERAEVLRLRERIKELEAKLETAECYFSMMVGGTVRCAVDGFSEEHESAESNLARQALEKLKGQADD